MLRTFMILGAQQILFGVSKNRNEMVGACGTYGEQKRTYRILVRKSDGGRPLGTRRRGWGIILKWKKE